MSVKNTLIAARKLIEDNGLARGSYEQNGCFCTYGAIIKTLHPEAGMSQDGQPADNLYGTFLKDNNVIEAGNALSKAMGVNDMWGVMNVNDESSKSEVLKYFDKAIEMCE